MIGKLPDLGRKVSRKLALRDAADGLIRWVKADVREFVERGKEGELGELCYAREEAEPNEAALALEDRKEVPIERAHALVLVCT